MVNDAGTEQIVCATDVGREGENIFRLIYEHARCRKPVQRLWVSSLTDKAIGEGFRRLRPGSAFDHLDQDATLGKAFFYELVAALEEGFSAKYSRNGQTRKACEVNGVSN